LAIFWCWLQIWIHSTAEKNDKRITLLIRCEKVHITFENAARKNKKSVSTFPCNSSKNKFVSYSIFPVGESFKAHRLVLAACSTHFSKIFANAPLNGQLIVILDGTRSPDLQILLQFMYRGVAFLPSDRIESVLRTGEALQVSCVSVILCHLSGACF
jgi:hypothetical protein